MKKLIALLMVCGFALAFTACGSKGGDESATDETTTEETAPAEEEAPAEEDAPADEVPAEDTTATEE